MISFNYETDFELENEAQYEDWISRIIESEGFDEGEINYIFCDDEYLHKINVEYLDHDTLTDIISFDYTVGNVLQGDIFVSVESRGKRIHLVSFLSSTRYFPFYVTISK